MANPLTLRIIRSTNLKERMAHLYFEPLAENDVGLFLQLAVLLINNSTKEVKELGYRILLKLCNRTRSYIPLYDISASLGYTPILEMLKRRSLVQQPEGFVSTFTEAYRQNFLFGEIFHTEEQKALFSSFSASFNQSLAVIAPTSYGKSELIEHFVEDQKRQNIAIVVPSKALITQTRRRVARVVKSTEQQILVHHDTSFDENRPVIAVVTQERLIRILQKHRQFAFDTLIVDEAHNLLADDRRARLLGSAIIIAKARNSKLAIKYLTPFLVTSDSLRLVGESNSVRQIRVEERLKSEEYLICDLPNGGVIKLYDQFLDQIYATPHRTASSLMELLQAHKKNKNVVYLNRPLHIELVATMLANQSQTQDSADLGKICEEIADYVHPQYKILNCLKRGVAYHHGSVPDVVRAYIESAFRKVPDVNWITTSSTLLEGVNIPADMLYVLDARKGRRSLSSAQFRNLVGRVNRFSEIFNEDNGDPGLLMPAICVAKTEFSHASMNVDEYIRKVAKIDKKITDDVANPLLGNSILDEDGEEDRLNDFIYIENIEPGVKYLPEPRQAQTEFGRLCFVHNVFEVRILEVEFSATARIELLKEGDALIADASAFMEAIHEVFIKSMTLEEQEKSPTLQRLTHAEARRFYEMFFDWRLHQSNYRKMVGNFFAYWRKKVEKNEDTLVFAGKWGTIAREGSSTENYVDLRTLSEFDMVNLAIVRIKEEQDFIDINLVKYLEVFNDLGMVDINFYNKVKYGTDNPKKIALIRSGLTHIAANIMIEKYLAFVNFGPNESVIISPRIRSAFSNGNERELVVFEVDASGLISDQ